MRNLTGRRAVLLPAAVAVAVTSGALATGCSGAEASPIEKACDRLVSLSDRTRSEGELPLHVYRQELAAAWTDAAQDPASALAEPLDRSIGIIDRTTNGYLLPAEQQHLTNQFEQIIQICNGS